MPTILEKSGAQPNEYTQIAAKKVDLATPFFDQTCINTDKNRALFQKTKQNITI